MLILKYTVTSVFLLLTLHTIAQNTEVSQQPAPDPAIRNITIGDKVPEIEIERIISNNTPSARISDFKNQLLLLDFWDTRCSNCIEALPKLNAMQQQFGKQLKVLPVTYEPEKVISAFFKNNGYVKKLSLPCVVADKILHNHFKHTLISHVVWIYKGEVKAITGTEYVKPENIQAVLDGKELDWAMKIDVLTFDPKVPIFALNNADQYNESDNLLEYSGITGYRKGIDVQTGITFDDDSSKHIYRTYFYNFSIVSAYIAAHFSIKPNKFLLSTPGRLVLEVRDPSKYTDSPASGYYEAWARKHEISYEAVTSKQLDKKSRLQGIILDLNQKLGLNGRMEKRLTKCLVIVPGKANVQLDTTAKKNGAIMTMSVVGFYMDMSKKYPPVIDESNSNEKFMINVDDFNDLTRVRKQLQDYGFDLIEAEREIDVLVITENDWKKPSH